MMYELISKKTSSLNIVDEETYRLIEAKGELKKYNIRPVKESKKPIPEEIVMKSKTIKPKNEINEG